jgi:PAS domain S-box-containing protein
MRVELDTLQQRLKYIRKRILGMSQRKLGEVLGVSWDSVNRWERGKSDIASRHLRKIGEVAEVSLEWLISGKGEMVPGEGSPSLSQDLISRINQIEKRLELHHGILLKNTAPNLVDELKAKVPDFIGDFKHTITKKTHALMKALGEVEKHYKRLTETPPVGEFIFQEDRFRYVNGKFRKLMGYDEQRLLNEPVWDLIHPEDREKVKQIGSARVRGEDAPTEYTFRAFKKNGEVVELLTSVFRIEYEGKPAAVGKFINLTERKQIENSLEALKQVIKES